MINLINYNGLASIDVDAAGEWKISSASLITYLEVEEGAHVYGEMIELADGSILIIPSEKTIGPGSYGTPFVYVAAPEYVAESTGN